MKYLGHVDNENGISTDPEKVYQRLACANLCYRSANFSRNGGILYFRFCPDMSTIAKPLNKLTSQGPECVWTQLEQQAFDSLKGSLVLVDVAGSSDPSLPYILDTDASNSDAGAVLSQMQNNKERVIAHFSMTFNPSERNDCVTREELLAVILAIRHFRSYLYGRKFRLRTDHT